MSTTLKSMRQAAKIGAASVVMAAAASAVSATVADATTNTDLLCNVSVNTWVRDAPWGNVLYTIPAGGGFRLIGFNLDGTWAAGHGNSQANGWIPNDGRIYNCH